MAAKSKTVAVATPLEAEQAEAGTSVPAFTMFGQEWQVLRKPPSLMVSRLGRITPDDPEAIGAIDQLIEFTLGVEQHRRFLRAYLAAVPDDGDDSELMTATIGAIFEATTGRPTR